MTKIAPTTSTPRRRALCFTPMETDRTTYVEAALAADRLGYEAIVVPEGWGLDAGSLLAELAVRTERIRLVSGIQSIWSRTAASLAMQTATLDRISDGRFTLGLGVSTPALAEGLHGTRFAQPVGRLRRTVEEVQALLRGDRAASLGGGRGVRLALQPNNDVAIWIAGLGPKSVAVASDLANGWFPAFVPRDRLADARRRLAPGSPCELISGPVVVAANAAEAARARARQLVGWYLTGMGSLYGDAVAANGFDDEVSALRERNPRPRPGAIDWPASADALLEQLAVAGDAAEVAAGLSAWDEHVDLLTVTIGPGSTADVLDVVEAATPHGACIAP